MDLINHPPIYQVSQFSEALKKHVETQFGYVRIRGEISGLKRATSGHVYYSLKDEKSVLNAICWRSVADKLSSLLEEGTEVIALGKITTYGARSNYQIIVEKLEIAGEGALLKMLNDRRKKLSEQGLFSRIPRLLPLMPQHIGVVSSATGAVIKDILHRIEQRMPCHVMLYPVRVQGQGAENEIAHAINALQKMTPRPDLIIVARGGGSLEDLWCFNEEIVVRAVAESTIPLISAIGHETDHTLIDEAADYRAPTPTAAAEMATPVKDDLLIDLNNYQQRLRRAISHFKQNNRFQLQQAGKFLTQKSHIFETYQQHIDFSGMKMHHAITRIFEKNRHHMQKIILPNIRNFVQLKKQQCNHHSARIDNIYQKKLQIARRKLEIHEVKLESYSYRKTLQRGFSLIKDSSGELIKQSHQLKRNQKIGIIFADGIANATIDE